MPAPLFLGAMPVSNMTWRHGLQLHKLCAVRRRLRGRLQNAMAALFPMTGSCDGNFRAWAGSSFTCDSERAANCAWAEASASAISQPEPWTGQMTSNRPPGPE